MYTTKPLSAFRSHPEEAASVPPPSGGSPGYLVIKTTDDDDGAGGETCCWGCCDDTQIRRLPFPQNRVITVREGDDEEDVVFIPVPGQPLSFNRYYAVLARGKHRGMVRPCSREQDVATSCFCCRVIRDASPRAFDPDDVYQQMEIVPHRKGGSFKARSVAADGHPYELYRTRYWQAYASRPKNFDLGEALGLNDPLRSRQLRAQDLTLSLHPAPAEGVVGRWYCPFFYVKEDGVPLKKQMDRATFYEVVLEQRRENVDAVRGSKMVLVGGVDAGNLESSGSSQDDGYVWFRAAAGQRVGVLGSMWEKMLWEERRGGWADEEDGVERAVIAAGVSSVLVERFAVKRMDGSVAVAFDFVHLNRARPM